MEIEIEMEIETLQVKHNGMIGLGKHAYDWNPKHSKIFDSRSR